MLQVNNPTPHQGTALIVLLSSPPTRQEPFSFFGSYFNNVLLATGLGGLSLFTRPTFLHGRDPSGRQDGHRDASGLEATLVWSNLLLSTPTPFQLMSCKSQRNRPESCREQHLTQAWGEPQLREDRL